MINIGELRKGLNITQKELAQIVEIVGMGRFRFTMAEHGLLTLNTREEATMRLAIAYTMHCRSVRLTEKLSQGTMRDLVPMTWDEYLKEHGTKNPKEERS